MPLKPLQPPESRKKHVSVMSPREWFRRMLSPRQQESLKRMWFRFTRSRLSILGLALSTGVILIAILAPFLAPYPKHVGYFINMPERNQPPNSKYLFGTDSMGRDVLTRCLFGFRYSLLIAATVLSIVVPLGSFLGLLAGYRSGTWIDTVIMRVTDVFIALPPLILAIAVCSVLEPSLLHSMFALCVSWWPWYTRLVYGPATSLRNEFYVQAAELVGASSFHIIFRELLPNMLGVILTKATLEVGIVIMWGATLSFVGLGAQPPTPDLGTMINSGSKYLPNIWWTTMFPGLCIILIILSFNLLGDGIQDMFVTERV